MQQQHLCRRAVLQHARSKCSAILGGGGQSIERTDSIVKHLPFGGGGGLHFGHYHIPPRVQRHHVLSERGFHRGHHLTRVGRQHTFCRAQLGDGGIRGCHTILHFSHQRQQRSFCLACTC
jgi:hypothetical protein